VVASTPNSVDILGTIAGTPLAIEVKTGKDSLRPQQEKFLSEWHENGGVSLVVYEDDIAELIAVLVTLKSKRKPKSHIIYKKKYIRRSFKSEK